MNELFPIPQTLSPRLAWLKKHDVRTFKTPGDDEGRNAWVAWTGEILPPNCTYGEGDTELDAIVALAIKLKIPLWNEEGFKA